ncbi:MAG: putative metal-dependent hydrolase [Gemmatimonadaceae bacterium]|nr:putative metal-dependent hydrolase [Gemmatimonadaceae bacterium]
MTAATDPRYPIGRFARPASLTAAETAAAIDALAALPDALRVAVDALDEAQLDTPYRDGGWTVRQLVHHVADSHTHMALRVRFALTVDEPTIMPYDENAWVALADASTLAVEPSLRIVEGTHARLVALLRALPASAFARRFLHPERGPMRLDETAALYAWHGRHHVAHVTALRERMGW